MTTPNPKRYQPDWKNLWKLHKSFPYTDEFDIDHPHVHPKIGADLLSDSPPKNLSDPVIVSVHGFAATPFENYFILEWLKTQIPTLRSSRIMSGAHGENIADFRKASWKDWQAPLIEELKTLSQQGYENIWILSTSTGGALVLDLLKNMDFPALKKLVFIAPIVEPYDKIMRLTRYVDISHIVPAVPNTFDDDWRGAWFRELPLRAIRELDRLTRQVRHSLKKGLLLKPELEIMVIQSRHEVVVDRRSVFYILDGLKTSHIETLMLNSKWHLPIFDRPKDPREERIKNWVYQRVLNFLTRQDLYPDHV